MQNNNEEIFSAEYIESESTETNLGTVVTNSVVEQTSVSEQIEYSLSKPKRVIIKAIIKND